MPAGVLSMIVYNPVIHDETARIGAGERLLKALTRLESLQETVRNFVFGHNM
ncbi:Unknown protein sequence [Pseudomonas savastanoi pv. glycinea]|uniref:Uncharacterized protein n=1 Tax=Pseudomonas savastanoi pv. glycinea TaxID=318 RepID=A0ABR5LE92_PSESG|nr:Unknown protein sequence [Pseudomonas savastanoi pv. glycinea]